MDITQERVEYIAQLAMLELTELEKKMYARQLTDILTHVSLMSELDTSNILPTSHPLSLSNVMREDEIKKSLQIEDVIANAPEAEKGHFCVPKVI